MGIVAFCPNGHRINVKTELAGKKGRCPTCGAKFRIPSAEPVTDEPVAGLPTARLLDVDPAVVATLPRVVPFATVRPPMAPAAVTASQVESAPSPPPSDLAPPPAPAPPLLHPVLAERPELPWCIAFPGGTPTDPLPAESMQAWLDACQAEGGEVVWRSDWPEWRPAREVFPDVLG